MELGKELFVDGRYDNIAASIPVSYRTGNAPTLSSPDFGSRMAFYF